MSGHRDLLAKGILAVGMLLAATSLAAAAFPSPEGLVKSLYGLYSANAAKPSGGGTCDDAASERGEGFPTTRKGAEQYLEPALALGYQKNDQDVGADPFINAQDWCLRDLVISVGKNDGKKATVTAQFTNLGNAHKITYELINTAKGWLIYDLSSPDIPSLRKLVKVRK
jgi:hypothetical protein